MACTKSRPGENVSWQQGDVRGEHGTMIFAHGPRSGRALDDSSVGQNARGAACHATGTGVGKYCMQQLSDRATTA